MDNNEANPYDFVFTSQPEYNPDLDYKLHHQDNEISSFVELKQGSDAANVEESIDNSEPAVYAMLQKENKPLPECVYAFVNKSKL